jgi:hypothetical protein
MSIIRNTGWRNKRSTRKRRKEGNGGFLIKLTEKHGFHGWRGKMGIKILAPDKVKPDR